MRRVDNTPLDPEIAAQLDAIDATLAGEPVDPAHAELAELALLLAAGRPQIEPGFAHRLDERAGSRFADRPAAGSPSAAGGGGRSRRWRWPSGSLLGPLAGLSTAAVAAVVLIVVLTSGGGGGSPSGSGQIAMPAVAGSNSSSTTASAGTSTSAASSAVGSAPSTASTPSVQKAPQALGRKSAGSSSGSAASTAAPQAGVLLSPASGAPNAPAPSPVPNGRKVIQSAQIALNAQSGHIDDVSQEIFNVVGRENGYVNNSEVTAGVGGYAQFQLSIPSGALQATMTALSQLHYATVASRTDATQDVNGEYLSDQRKLADARALRTSLLKQLAAATTQEQIDSLKAQIQGAEASIRSDESTLNGLNHRISFSQLTVVVNPASAPAPQHHHSSGFGLGTALHDAGRVLTVGAGVALIALAVLVPLGLIAAIAWWIAAAARRRQREHALDMA